MKTRSTAGVDWRWQVGGDCEWDPAGCCRKSYWWIGERVHFKSVERCDRSRGDVQWPGPLSLLASGKLIGSEFASQLGLLWLCGLFLCWVACLQLRLQCCSRDRAGSRSVCSLFWSRIVDIRAFYTMAPQWLNGLAQNVVQTCMVHRWCTLLNLIIPWFFSSDTIMSQKLVSLWNLEEKKSLGALSQQLVHVQGPCCLMQIRVDVSMLVLHT